MPKLRQEERKMKRIPWIGVTIRKDCQKKLKIDQDDKNNHTEIMV